MRWIALILIVASCATIPDGAEIAKYEGETFDWDVVVEVFWLPEATFEVCQWRKMRVTPKPKLHYSGVSDPFSAQDIDCDGQWDYIRATRGPMKLRDRTLWMFHQDIDHAFGIVVPIEEQGKTR